MSYMYKAKISIHLYTVLGILCLKDRIILNDKEKDFFFISILINKAEQFFLVGNLYLTII